MLSKLAWKLLSEIEIKDPFFDSLRADYEGTKFDAWFLRKANEGKRALVLYENNLIHAFLFLQRQNENIILRDTTLPACKRLKISTLKLDDNIGRQRLGEGVIGVALWYWQRSKLDEIFVTVFSKQEKLIGLLQHFGFKPVGSKTNGEIVFLRSRNSINYSSPYTSFPFITPSALKAGIIPINDYFHDRLFPYSDSVYKKEEIEEVTAGNGITKVYIGNPYTATHYSVGEVIGVYRRYTGPCSKGCRSAITSYCTITRVILVKKNGNAIFTEDEFLSECGNKTVFTKDELLNNYRNNSNVVMIEMLYNGFFSQRNHVTYKQLKSNGLFDAHPYNIDYSINQFKEILKLGGVDVDNTFIN